MDYTSFSFFFKLKKVFRYIQLYGLGRTWIKVQGQYHMKKKYESLPSIDKSKSHIGNVGLIGCGNYAYGNIAYYLKKNYGKVIRGCMDINIHHAASLCSKYNCLYYSDSVDELLNDPDIDTYYIATNHATHAEYAIQALNRNKNIHIEKPHAVTEDQLRRLISAMDKSNGKILSVGFNRPISKMGNIIKNAIESQQGTGMFNWFIAGHELDPNHWYFKEEEGGRILGNLCHWIDFTYNLVSGENRYPITIVPIRSTASASDIAVTYQFGDGTIAVITFSAKGHTFEGVRERFAAQKGNILIAMDDFKNLIIDEVETKRRINLKFRDHGHQISVKSSYDSSIDSNNNGMQLRYVWESGQLFLKTKEAIDAGKTITVNGIKDL